MSGAPGRAATPEDLAVLFVERANARNAEGLAALYEADAVLAFPLGQMTTGRDAIRAVFVRMFELGLEFAVEEPLPTIYHGDLALTSTFRKDGSGIRVQVARRQQDGTWLRMMDRPESPPEPG